MDPRPSLQADQDSLRGLKSTDPFGSLSGPTGVGSHGGGDEGSMGNECQKD